MTDPDRRPRPHSEPHLSESIDVAAPAGHVYALVSDLPRMGEWSPECTGIRWRGTVRAPVEGARFIGHNRKGALRWSTSGEIVEAAPDGRFAFEITVGPVKVARWTYLIEDARDGHGCTVTEQWTDRRPALVRRVMDATLGSRAAANVKGMRVTLRRLKEAAEATVGSI